LATSGALPAVAPISLACCLLSAGACAPGFAATAARSLDAPVLAPLPEGSPGRIELRRFEGRPRLTLVTREGDPEPAVAVVFAAGAGAALTTALAAVVESRVRAAGLDVDVRVDRDAFRLTAPFLDAGRVAAWLATLAAAAARPITPGSAEVTLALQRLQSLRRNPLDAPELAAAAACTGALGIAPGEALPDLTSDAGLRELETARRTALHADAIAVAAVGPSSFVAQVGSALERSAGWPPPDGTATRGAWPSSDAAGVYTASGLDRHAARLTLAARVSDPLAAAAAAERLGAPDSPLVARLQALPEAWRVVQVAGVARTRGGCVGLVLETAQASASAAMVGDAAFAAAVARREVLAELAVGGVAMVAGRQVLAASDPGEAASRAAWWSLAAVEPSAPPRWILALGIPVPRDRSLRDGVDAATNPAADARFLEDIDRAAGSDAMADRKLAVERGQGELWMLLASPCGVAEESAPDAGLGALATLGALESRRRPDGVRLEPWITSDGVGVFAHASLRDGTETEAELARRVGDAAARAFTATTPDAEARAASRAAILEHLERADGPQGAALAALAAAAAPDHPSWLEPFGLWSKIAGAGADAVRTRSQALAHGPLRVAVLANASSAQAAAAADAVDRWLSPALGPRTCRAGAPLLPRPGRYEAHLPSTAPLSQGLVGVPLPGSPWRDLAELTAAALDGLLAAGAGDATATARVAGGGRAPMLIVDVRAPSDGLAAAVAEVRAILLRLPSGATDADLARALAARDRRERAARADPRRRLADLWSGRPPAPLARPTLAAWRAYLAATMRDSALVVVEARPQ
jgi:hypothetical protein